jgi:hypothetical protein
MLQKLSTNQIVSMEEQICKNFFKKIKLLHPVKSLKCFENISSEEK